MSEEAAQAIRNAIFTPVRLRQGYDMGEVDEFLDRLEVAARAGEDLGPLLAQAGFSRVRLREGYDIGDVDAFLARLADRG